ncbi:GNAT family N-acetyltransferase [Thalassobacillus sp. CUG 92003]|uniref:GNAT family N-acetyltransferase n=1 Tax=Thalassobacillus sp. CUG 92003 TaxID=2736641 RepID=UPI0015E69590|nr:GNAT family N-acetyltransferase [Thalassobacillus sp. CUG 92003]
MIKVRAIDPKDTHKLRQLVLRPNQTIEACEYPGDESPSTFHLGAFENNELIGIASFYFETSDAVEKGNQYRIRGMAIHPDHRGLRIGTTLIHKANRVLFKEGVDYMWCNARTSALAFYERIGFQQASDVFEIEPIGPHVILYKPVEQP